MIVLQLTPEEAAVLAAPLATSEVERQGVLIAYDPIDRAVKLKWMGRWSLPLGTVIADD